MQQQQPQKPPIFQEVIVTLRRQEGDPPNLEVKAYRHANWQIQGVGSGVILVVTETTYDKMQHVFPWELIERLDTVPSKIELVGTGGEAL